MSLVFRYEDVNGALAEFEPDEFKLLDFTDIIRAIKGEKTFAFEIKANQIKVISGDQIIYPPENLVKMKIDFHHSLETYALVEGGWLPMPFCKPRNYLVDYNVIVDIEKLIAGKTVASAIEKEWWTDMIRSPETVFNPLLFAFEGEKKTFPSLDEFKELFQKGSSTIKAHLPEVNVLTMDDETACDVYDILSQMNDRYLQRHDFLMEVIPLIQESKAKNQKAKFQDQIFDAADKFGLNYFSFPFLAVLSCLYESTQGGYYQASRKVLKASPKFDSDTAYNALADINGLELFAAMQGLAKGNPNNKYAFCTSDKPLSVFGAGLNPRNVTINDKGANFTVSIDKNLFPDLDSDERDELLKRFSS